MRSPRRPRSSRSPARWSRPSLEALEVRAVPTDLTLGLFDTGVNNQGGTLAAGQADPHFRASFDYWSVDSSPAVTASSAPGTIAPASDTGPTGPAYFRTSFFKGTPFVAAGHLLGSIAASGPIEDIRINGVSTEFTQPASDGLSGFDLPTLFQYGRNVIELRVGRTIDGDQLPTLLIRDLQLKYSPLIAMRQSSVGVAFGQTATDEGTLTDPDPAARITYTSSIGTVTPSADDPSSFQWSLAGASASGPVTITATDQFGNSNTVRIELAVSAPAQDGAPITALAGGPAVVINPNYTIRDLDGPDLDGASVRLYKGLGDAVIDYQGSIQLIFQNQNGIVGSYDPNAHLLTLSGRATRAQYQAALRTVAYQDTLATPHPSNAADLTAVFTASTATYDPVSGHYYRAITAPGTSWEEAQAAAGASTLDGLQGYLATLGGSEHHLYPVVDSSFRGWVVAAPSSVWYLEQQVAGPGMDFPITGRVDLSHVYLLGQTGFTVRQEDSFGITGYLVEYGGSAGDPLVGLASTTPIRTLGVSFYPSVYFPPVADAGPINTPNVAITGFAEFGGLIRVYSDANGDGRLDAGDPIVGTQQLADGPSSETTPFRIVVPLAPNAANHLLVTNTDPDALESVPIPVTYTTDLVPPPIPLVLTPSQVMTTMDLVVAIEGTADVGSLNLQEYANDKGSVAVYLDRDGDGLVDAGDSPIAQEVLEIGQTSFRIVVPLVPGQVNHLLVTAIDPAGNESSPAVVPTVVQSSGPGDPPVNVPTTGTATLTIQGRVVLNGRGIGIPGPGLPGRVVFIDANNSGIYDEGEPTTVTDADGNFVFTNVTAPYVGVLDRSDQAPSHRYRVVQTFSVYGPSSDIELGVIPYSPIFAVPVSVDPGLIVGFDPGTTAATVQSLYRAVLGRDGNAIEVNEWVATIDSQNLADADVAQRFVNSLEHRIDQVIGYYRDFLGRALDPFAQNWINLLLSGTSEQAVVEGILGSDEYQQAQGRSDAATYVRDLYLDVLGRVAGEGEVSGFTTALSGGLSRQAAAQVVVESAEAADQLVTSFYVNDLRRQPEGGDSSGAWRSRLLSGASATEVALGILTSAEFRGSVATRFPSPVS